MLTSLTRMTDFNDFYTKKEIEIIENVRAESSGSIFLIMSLYVYKHWV